ncbi:MAG TPA: hypothetical protein PKD70_13980 [Saprospiraceae bacterium]|nr:hypothetical protein [Saprospiraceae bacterium]HMP14982.1 hypothetical protein [Saprospiraceae bacterium]
MPLPYKDIKNEQQWLATIDLSSAKFYLLVALFKESYEQLYGVSLEQGAAHLNKQWKLDSYEACLFYVLFELKNGLTYDVLGFWGRGQWTFNVRPIMRSKKRIIAVKKSTHGRP